jgi:urease accessory protein UreH
VTVGAGGEAVIRMASATVVHDRRSKPAVSQRVVLRVGDGGQLLYLPRSLILLPGSGVVQSTEIVLGQRSAALVQDSFLMHDPAGFLPDERILDSRVIIRNPSGRLLALDRMRIADEVFAAAVPGVVGDYRAFGTVWLLEASEGDAYRALKAALALAAADSDGCYLAMTPLRSGSGAMIRIAARDGGDLDAALAVIRAACIDCLNNRHMPIHAPDTAVAHH